MFYFKFDFNHVEKIVMNFFFEFSLTIAFRLCVAIWFDA